MDNNFSTVDTSTVDASNNWKIAINESLNHLKKLVKMDKLRPKLSILTPDDKEKLDNKETSNDNKIEYLVKVLPQRANHWWDHLLSSLKDADDNLLKLAARIIEIKKYSVRICIYIFAWPFVCMFMCITTKQINLFVPLCCCYFR